MKGLTKKLTMGLGAIGLVLLGAGGMWIINKINSPFGSVLNSSENKAQIVKVQPHYVFKTIAYRDCRSVAETAVQPAAEPTGAGALIGGVAGAAAGTAVRGNGQTAAIVGGALLGALAGHAIEGGTQHPETYTVYKPVCTTRYAKKSSKSGYEVTYIYNGQERVTIMQIQPAVGSVIELPQSLPLKN